MTLAQLKSLCAAYHLKSTGDLTVNGVDLFLAAANNARRSAEQLHDFEFTRVTATLSIDGVTGGGISSATITGNSTDAYTDGINTYTRYGSYSGYPLYINTGVSPVSFIYFNTAAASYVLADLLQTGALTDYATPTVPVLTPPGHYIGHGADMGSDLDIALSSAPLFSGIKEVTNVLRTGADGQLIPLDFKSLDSAIEGTRTEIEVSDYYDPAFRFPSDATFLALQQGSLVVQRNRTLFIYPKATTTTDPLSVLLEGYAWLADYNAASLTISDPPDFLFEHGQDYFQWYIICELNYLFKTFVPRSEGNIGAPENLKADALRKLIIWDSYQIAVNSTSSR